MFTGLIEYTGEVSALEWTNGIARLVVQAPSEILKQLKPGDSIAVDGVCLTVTERTGDCFQVEVIPETLSRTTIRSWGPGRRVNLELPCRPDTLLGGHLVQGHVDGVTRLKDVRHLGEAIEHLYERPPSWRPYIVEKGSIAINGVSLTVAEVTDEGFRVALIPATLEKTNLGTLAPGDVVNVEVDVIAKYIYHLMRPYLETFRSEDASNRPQMAGS